MRTEKTTRKFSIKDRISSFRYAINGIVYLLKTEHNARIHSVVAIIVVIASFILKIAKWEWICVIFAIGLVFMTELINTSLEYLADVISPGDNDKVGKAKDLAAGAVLVASLIALLVGCIVFIPKLF